MWKCIDNNEIFIFTIGPYFRFTNVSGSWSSRTDAYAAKPHPSHNFPNRQVKFAKNFPKGEFSFKQFPLSLLNWNSFIISTSFPYLNLTVNIKEKLKKVLVKEGSLITEQLWKIAEENGGNL